MEHTKKFRIGSTVSLLLLLTSLSGTVAWADGLSSKDKLRIPQPAGLEIHAGEHIFQGIDLSGSTVPTSDEEKIGIQVRRNARLQQRKTKIQATEEHKTVPSQPGNRIDRERLIRHGRTELKSSCMALHTHDRAICLRDAQLERMVRFQSTALRVSER